MWDLFLQQKTAALQRSVPWDFDRISQISFFFFRQNIKKPYYGLPQESPCLLHFYCNANMNFKVL